MNTETAQTQLTKDTKIIMQHIYAVVGLQSSCNLRYRLISVQTTGNYQVISAGNSTSIHTIQCDFSKLDLPDGNYTINQAIPRGSNPIITLTPTDINLTSAADILLDTMRYIDKVPPRDFNATDLHIDPVILSRSIRYLDTPVHIKFHGQTNPVELISTLGDGKFMSRNLVMPFFNESLSY